MSANFSQSSHAASRQPASLSDAKSSCGITPTISERITALVRASSYFQQSDGAHGMAPVAELAPLTLLAASRSELLLIARDPALDPVLCKWLDMHVAKARALSSQVQQSDYLLGAVQRTFGATHSLLPHPILRAHFDRLTNGEDDTPRLLGEIIQNRIGVCRHVAPLLQLAFQETGISSTLMYGSLSRSYNDSPDEPPSKMPHVWNIAVIDGNALALDPINKINDSIGRVTQRTISSAILFENFEKTRVVSRTDEGWLWSGTRSVLTPARTALAGPLWINESMTQTFVLAVERARKSFGR